MKKKLFIFALLVCCSFISRAQATLSPQVPPAGILLKSQLWNILIVSTGDYPGASISLKLSDAVTGEPIFTAATSAVNVLEGSNQFSAENLPGIVYDYQSPDIDRNPDGFLMVGSFIACYTLTAGTHGTPTQDCIPVIVEPVSPPVLNTPFNEEVIQTSTPQFTWIPPSPLEIFSELKYDFKLVEVNEGQNSADAIQQNIPIYSSNQVDPFLNYPSSGYTLDTARKYAWQIIARNKDTYAAQSDVWTFSIMSPTVLPEYQLVNNYLKLKRNLDGSTGTAIGTLNTYYLNESEDSTVSYTIMDINEDSNEPYSEIKSGSIKLIPGQNAIVIPFSAADGFQDGKIYLFQLINSRQEKWSIKFIYFKNNL